MQDGHRSTPQVIRDGVVRSGCKRHHQSALRDEIQPPGRLQGVPRRMIYPTFMTQAQSSMAGDSWMYRYGRGACRRNRSIAALTFSD